MATLPYIIPYDPAFLLDGFQVPYPGPACHGQLLEEGRAFDYLHYSLVMHRNRRTALFTAHNIDMAQKRSAVRHDNWSLDPRIGAAFQTGPAAYVNNPWDRGHLVRRDDVAWGGAQEAQDASDATFYFSNAAPQHERFNQDEWLKLEDWVQQKAGAASARLCVFCGPLYTIQDQFVGDVRIPSAFWKIVVLRDPTAPDDDLAALGFVMKQNELWADWNGAAMLDLHLYQVGITEIGGYTGLQFGDLALLDEFEWRQARFRDRTRMRPIPITGPDDLRFFGDRRRERGIRALRMGSGGGANGTGERARQAGRVEPVANRAPAAGSADRVRAAAPSTLPRRTTGSRSWLARSMPSATSSTPCSKTPRPRAMPNAAWRAPRPAKPTPASSGGRPRRRASSRSAPASVATGGRATGSAAASSSIRVWL